MHILCHLSCFLICVIVHFFIASGLHVLELGAGNGLPGVLASLFDADVVLTDAETADRVLEGCRISCALNRIPARGNPINLRAFCSYVITD